MKRKPNVLTDVGLLLFLMYTLVLQSKGKYDSRIQTHARHTN